MSDLSTSELSEAPLHGYRGESEPTVFPWRPRGVSVAITRESGARGGSIAQRVARQLGWQVFGHESLDHLVRDDSAWNELQGDLPDGALSWISAHARRLTTERSLGGDREMVRRIEVLLALAARGEAIIVGCGAGFVLPSATTIHARIVAPIADRAVYLADWLRLPPVEAHRELADRDQRRSAFLAAVAPGEPTDPLAFDLILNSSRLGEELSASLIVEAVRARHRHADWTNEEPIIEPA